MTSYNQADIPNHLNNGRTTVANPAVFVFAHQDDETLTFGAEIENHKVAGRYIIGVCATDGRSSSTRVLTGLDIPGFVQARNLELISAASCLGIDELYMEGAADAGLTQAQADALAVYWTNRFPTGSFKVPSDRDDNVDHKALGVAFRKIKNSRPTADIRFYTKPEQRAELSGVMVTAPTGAPARLAAAEYQRVDHDNGRYGIGQLSVPFDFQGLADGSAPVLSYWNY